MTIQESVPYTAQRRASDFTPEQIATYAPKLKPRYRAVLCATGTYEEMAAALGINVGTLKSRLHRARGALAREITRGQHT